VLFKVVVVRQIRTAISIGLSCVKRRRRETVPIVAVRMVDATNRGALVSVIEDGQVVIVLILTAPK
jgi:saccharopine dehydrogenase-like NADP-dependent oxidoreductase